VYQALAICSQGQNKVNLCMTVRCIKRLHRRKKRY